MKFEWTCFSSVTLWTKKGQYEQKNFVLQAPIKTNGKNNKNKKKKKNSRIGGSHRTKLRTHTCTLRHKTLGYYFTVRNVIKKNLCFLFKGFPYWSRREGQFLGWYLIIVSFSFQLMVIMMSFKKSISIFDQGRERERERMEGSLNSAFFFFFFVFW